MFGNLDLHIKHPIGAKPWGCTIVTRGDGAPVYSGDSAARVEVRPGDCAANAGFDDFANDRTRFEMSESQWTPLPGQVVRYETHVYISSQQRLRPNSRFPNDNPVFLTQFELYDSDYYATRSDAHGILAFLEMGLGNRLMVRTHKEFTTSIDKQYLVTSQPYDRWIQMDYEVRAAMGSDGYIRVWADGALMVDEARPTMPTQATKYNLSVGIYNAFISRATEPYGTQLVYFDELNRSVR